MNTFHHINVSQIARMQKRVISQVSAMHACPVLLIILPWAHAETENVIVFPQLHGTTTLFNIFKFISLCRMLSVLNSALSQINERVWTTRMPTDPLLWRDCRAEFARFHWQYYNMWIYWVIRIYKKRMQFNTNSCVLLFDLLGLSMLFHMNINAILTQLSVSWDICVLSETIDNLFL